LLQKYRTALVCGATAGLHFTANLEAGVEVGRQGALKMHQFRPGCGFSGSACCPPNVNPVRQWRQS
jgi:hypothetical protein